MPFTPVHLGVGILAKGIAPKRFSLLVFAGTQVLIDIEPLVNILRGNGHVHALTHNALGAFLIAVLSIFLWRGWERFGWPRLLPLPRISTPVLVFSAFFGTYSHIVLDAWCHPDVMIQMGDTYRATIGQWPVDPVQVCFYSAILGGFLLLGRAIYARWGRQS